MQVSVLINVTMVIDIVTAMGKFLKILYNDTLGTLCTNKILVPLWILQFFGNKIQIIPVKNIGSSQLKEKNRMKTHIPSLIGKQSSVASQSNICSICCCSFEDIFEIVCFSCVK